MRHCFLLQLAVFGFQLWPHGGEKTIELWYRLKNNNQTCRNPVSMATHHTTITWYHLIASSHDDVFNGSYLFRKPAFEPHPVSVFHIFHAWILVFFLPVLCSAVLLLVALSTWISKYPCVCLVSMSFFFNGMTGCPSISIMSYTNHTNPPTPPTQATLESSMNSSYSFFAASSADSVSACNRAKSLWMTCSCHELRISMSMWVCGCVCVLVASWKKNMNDCASIW